MSPDDQKGQPRLMGDQKGQPRLVISGGEAGHLRVLVMAEIS